MARATAVMISQADERGGAVGDAVALERGAGRRPGRRTPPGPPTTGDSWAMPDSAAPSSRSTRNTKASDHTAARWAMQPMAMNTAT